MNIDQLKSFEIWLTDYRDALIEVSKFGPVGRCTPPVESVEAALMYVAAYREATAPQDNQKGEIS